MISSSKKSTQEQFVADYLSFLGLPQEAPSLDYLNNLMKAHLYKVPFDGSNFSLHQPERLSLSNKAILKGLKEGKGSICYQSHGAFKKLLVLLGFDATLSTVTMFRFGRDNPRPYANKNLDVHSAILVTIDEKEYLVDLVWGNAFRQALPIGEEQSQVKGEDTRLCIKNADLYQLKVKVDGKWEVEYQLKKENKKTKDFKNDIEFIAGKEQFGITHHLSQALLLMQPLPGGEFEYLYKEIYSDKSPSLFFYHKYPDQSKSVPIEIKEKSLMKDKLKSYGVDAENIEKIIDLVIQSESPKLSML